MSLWMPMSVLNQQGAAGPGTAVEHDFTATTTGDLSLTDPTTDETGLGWAAFTGGGAGTLTDWDFMASNTGVRFTTTGGTNSAAVTTDGREDVQVTLTGIDDSTFSTNRHIGMCVRGPGSYDGLALMFDGGTPWTDLDIKLYDDNQGTVLKTWDVSALTGATLGIGEEFTMVVRCSGDDIILYALTFGGQEHVLDDAYTLTGAAATAHGAGSAQDQYGLYSSERYDNNERYAYFKVESIPA